MSKIICANNAPLLRYSVRKSCVCGEAKPTEHRLRGFGVSHNNTVKMKAEQDSKYWAHDGIKFSVLCPHALPSYFRWCLIHAYFVYSIKVLSKWVKK